MDVVQSDYDKFDSHIVCMKALSTYFIMARLSRITGLEWSKMYEKLHIVLVYSLQKEHLVDVENHTDLTWTKGLCIPCKLSRIYTVYTSTVFNGVISNKVM